MAEMDTTSEVIGPQHMPAEVALLVLDYLRTTDFETCLDVNVFPTVNADHERLRRRCRETKKRELVRLGDVDALQYIYETRGARFVLQDMALAAAGGRMAAVKWLWAHAKGGHPCAVLECAAARGHYSLVSWLCDHIQFTQAVVDEAVDCAAEAGHVYVVDYLCTHHRATGTARAIFGAVLAGRIDIVKRLHSACPSHASALGRYQRATPRHHAWRGSGSCRIKFTTDRHPNQRPAANEYDAHGLDACSGHVGLVDVACASGHLSMLAYLWENQIGKVSPCVFECAALGANVEIIEYLWAHHAAIDERIVGLAVLSRVMDIAARSGSIVVCVLLGTLFNVPYTHRALIEAARLGRNDMIDLFRAMGAQVATEHAVSAASAGHVATIEHLHCLGVPLNRSVMLAAIQHGHLDVFRFLWEGQLVSLNAYNLEQIFDEKRVDMVRCLVDDDHGTVPWADVLVWSVISQVDVDTFTRLLDKQNDSIMARNGHHASFRGHDDDAGGLDDDIVKDKDHDHHDGDGDDVLDIVVDDDDDDGHGNVDIGGDGERDDDTDSVPDLVDYCDEKTQYAIMEAIEYGRGDILDVLLARIPHQDKKPVLEFTQCFGASGCHPDLFDRVSCKFEIDWESLKASEAQDNAIFRDDVAMLSWMEKHGAFDPTDARMQRDVQNAIQRNHRRTVEWLWNRGARPDIDLDRITCAKCPGQPAKDHHATAQFWRANKAQEAADRAQGPA